MTELRSNRSAKHDKYETQHNKSENKMTIKRNIKTLCFWPRCVFNLGFIVFICCKVHFYFISLVVFSF